MGIAPLGLQKQYWDTFEITEEDLEFLYNYLLDLETPLTPQELIKILVTERIRKELQALEKLQTSAGALYMPKNHYETGQKIQFPAFDWQAGQVASVRTGVNPDLPPFEVIEVDFVNGEKHSFASGITEHPLNLPVQLNNNDPQLDASYVLKTFSASLIEQITEQLESNSDLVRIAGRWFPRALLVDIGIGHLNLAEAILEVEGGGPLTTRALLEQLDLPTDVNAKLNEFSLNLALQEDGRFDEVGPSGKTLWYLRRMEPEGVQQPPIQLRYAPIAYDENAVAPLLNQFEGSIADEFQPDIAPAVNGDSLVIPLLYPHFRAGTLPLNKVIHTFFPTAYESPRVQFTFIDSETGKQFGGWVVREYNYVYGLRDWYLNKGLIPGSLITISRGQNPGEVIIKAGQKRPTRNIVRTIMIGSDGGIVFADVKQVISATLDERMAIAIPDQTALDKLWETNQKSRTPLAQSVKMIMRELAKLSPQGLIHVQELYAALNVLRRCPPGPILAALIDNRWAVHMGDLYFKLDESAREES